jgi:signal transduction histidine kinase
MTAVELLTYAAHALFVAVAIRVGIDAYRSPTSSNVNILAFFGLLSFVIAQSWLWRLLAEADFRPVTIAVQIMTMTLPFVLLRLARDFSTVPTTIMRLAAVGLAISFALIVYPGTDASPFIPFLLAAYFAVVAIYASYRFHDAARDANGITRRRLRAVTWASALLGVAILSAGFSPLLEGTLATASALIRQLMILACALLYLFGFTPPTLVRRGWQEPELIKFLNHTVHLPRAASIPDMLGEIQAGAAETLGAPHAAIGLWNPETGLLDYHNRDEVISLPSGKTIGGRAFDQQRPVLSVNAPRDDPESRELYERSSALAVLAAPITVNDHRIGVLAVYAPNPPIFAQDDLELATLIADQTAILLENRMYFEHAAEVRAREEAIRLKDDFLSSAAHDLKTPLTTIVAAGQYLERRLRMAQKEGPEIATIERLNREARRLQTLVQELLDAGRVEQGRLVASTERADLAPIVRDIGELRQDLSQHRVVVDAPATLVGEFDTVRIQQLVENLVENAVKYSPAGGTITVRAWEDGDQLRVAVSDEGIGINPSEREAIFDRFHRGKNVDDRVFSGMGLGLFICKGIVEQHGGEIWVESELARGSTFHVALPTRNRAPSESGEDDPARRRRSEHSADPAGHPVAGGVSGTDRPRWAGGAPGD